MVQRGDGVLRLPAQASELGGVLVERADAFLASHPGSAGELRRLFTLKLATVRPLPGALLPPGLTLSLTKTCQVPEPL